MTAAIGGEESAAGKPPHARWRPGRSLRTRRARAAAAPTDHGPQFTCGDARDLCDEWRADHTFAPISRPTRNAVAEGFLRTLKEEVLEFTTVDDVRRAVEAWWPTYNQRRPHRALKNATPAEVRTSS